MNVKSKVTDDNYTFIRRKLLTFQVATSVIQWITSVGIAHQDKQTQLVLSLKPLIGKGTRDKKLRAQIVVS